MNQIRIAAGIKVPLHSGELTHPLVLFDGVCNLCESTVQFIIKRDKNAIFRFAPLQSATAMTILAEHGEEEESLSSVILLDDNGLHRKSRAALRIAKQLDGLWPILFYAFYWIPSSISNLVYDYIGNRRYQWFGKKEECWIPDGELLSRFIED